MEINASISFLIEDLDGHNAGFRSVTPAVNGIRLTELIWTFESVRQYEPAGGYGGLILELFDYGPLDRYFLGECESESNWARLNGIYVLGCDCGEVGCWPLLCRVSTGADIVIWEAFEQPHRRERDYSQFGPFTFDAASYHAAVRKLPDLIQTTRY